jgi:hypothetical protein
MRTFAITLLSLLCLFGLAAVASASQGGGSGHGGPHNLAASNQEVIFSYEPSGECLDAFVAGCKLRNAPGSPPSASGTITVPATVAGSAVFAQLYWVILADAAPPATETLNGNALVRIPIGPVTASPCWPEKFAFAYRADVKGILVAGANTLAGFSDTGVLGGGDNTEGASIVAAYHTNGVDKEIIITAGNDLLDNGNGVGNAVLPLPVAGAAGTGAELYFIGADGQVIFPDEVFWNGIALDAGNAWQGIDPGPGSGYWDSLKFGVTVGGANTASCAIPTDAWDCVNWVGTVLGVKSGGCQTVPVTPESWGRVKQIYR